jgi:predicted nucleic acid-binding protein
MVAEAVQKGLVTPRVAVKKLREKPDLVKQLTKYHEDVGKIRQINIILLSLTPEILTASEEVRKTEGLLTNDSFIVAFMRDRGITKLATSNGDFDHVHGIEVYKPTDL